MLPLIAVVDDDISVRESLESLIRSVGMEVRVFESAEEFLNSAHPKKPDCLILDVRMPGMSGIELHRCLLARNYNVPVVFITAHGSDVRARSEASSDWTVAYLAKPFSDDELLDAIHAASRLNSNHNQNRNHNS
jgi:FixJ family two-component response regulator